MNKLRLIVDGMLSGAGIRSAIEGGYLSPSEVGVSESLSAKISLWLHKYETAHYFQFEDQSDNDRLDREGIEMSRMLQREIPDADVSYFSNFKMKYLPLYD